MKEAHYNNGNTDEPAKFFYITTEDVNNATPYNYTSYLYNVTKLHGFIKGLFQYSLYEDGWEVIDDSRNVKGEEVPNVECSKQRMFEFFMAQLALSIEAEQKTRDAFVWDDARQRTIFMSSLKDIYLPDYNYWKKQMDEHNQGK